MNRLKTNLLLFFTVIIGFIAIGSFYFFYSEQKEFSKEQKEFMLTLNQIQINEATLILALLESYLYAYNNNDDIERPLLALEKNFDILKNATILEKQNYQILLKDLETLQNEIDTLFNNTQRFIMLNASIKNSLLFLASYDNKLNNKTNPKIYNEANKILQSLLYTKRIADINFLHKHAFLLIPHNATKKEKKFIQAFNEHVAFLQKVFPLFFQIDAKIKNNKIPQTLQTIKKKFSHIVLNDTKLLDRFTFILFLIFMTTYIYLLILFFKYKKEHKELQELSNSLEKLLIYDHLTEVKNRYAFNQDHTTIAHPIIVLVSIDRFKDINDVYGTYIGDQFLIHFSQFLKQVAQTQKHFYDIYRIGGDEFCLVFNHDTLLHIQKFAKKLHHFITAHEFIINTIPLTVSVTIAINDKYPYLENADLALKHIKKDKNLKIITYDPSLNLHQSSLENITILNLIKKAIQNDHVKIYFQPIIHLPTKQIQKYEILVRIIYNNTIYYPDQFIPISKKTHLYQEITKIVIEKTMQTAKQYPQYRFSINLSMSDIENKPLIDQLFLLYENNPNIASKIDIELVETERLDDLLTVKNFIDRVHSYGSYVLIDDFGSGYSNFAYFSELDIDIVKIDGTIINEIVHNKRKRHMLDAIVKFCKGMNVKIVAEFVDNKEIIAILEALEIDFAQGYFFSKPLPKPELKEHIYGKRT